MSSKQMKTTILTVAADFICPQDFAKCTNSYCVPVRFLCDGKEQCSGGEDETKCGEFYHIMTKLLQYGQFGTNDILYRVLKIKQFVRCMTRTHYYMALWT